MTSSRYRSAIHQLLGRIEKLNAIGVALSQERDIQRLAEMILFGAMELVAADGGTIYQVGPENLAFLIMRTDSLGVRLGGTSGEPIPFTPIPLKLPDGRPNLSSVVVSAVLRNETINIADAYHAEGYDFSGTRTFDARTGYRSTSMLTVPMRNHEGEITGVLQLLNAQDDDGRIEAFSEADQRLVESLASQAAIAMDQRELIEDQRALFESFIRLIATAIDEKSPYTGSHCHRVPELTMMLAEAAARSDHGPLAAFTMNAADRYELQTAAWLHDCGKITTPEWVMDKATKLSCIHDRIALVEARVEVAKRDAVIRALEGGGTRAAAASECADLDADLLFLRQCNTGSEAMRPEDQERVRVIAKRHLLTDDEVRNLTIAKGTLLPEERAIINHHIVATIKMLESLPYPKHLRRVPEFAGGHHERMDGKGYPKGLTREQMSVQARVMGIADIFEALTARDRPYKQPMKLSQALQIMGRMARDGHIDPDLFHVFVADKVYQDYAQRFLPPDQLDVVDERNLPGYSPPRGYEVEASQADSD